MHFDHPHPLQRGAVLSWSLGVTVCRAVLYLPPSNEQHRHSLTLTHMHTKVTSHCHTVNTHDGTPCRQRAPNTQNPPPPPSPSLVVWEISVMSATQVQV